jgi:hypothetical protein
MGIIVGQSIPRRRIATQAIAADDFDKRDDFVKDAN